MTHPTSSDTCSPALLGEWTELKESLAHEWPALVGPFPGYKPASFDDAVIKILYIGKATGGSLKTSELEHVYKHKSTDFWTFARVLRDALSARLGRSADFAWSNVLKLGVEAGNPDPILLEKQRSLAVKTLQSEFRKLRPSLVVFVTDGYADKIVYEVIGVTEVEGAKLLDLETHQGTAKDFYSRQAVNACPPVLWVQHPQGKPLIARAPWVDKAVELLSAPALT